MQRTLGMDTDGKELARKKELRYFWGLEKNREKARHSIGRRCCGVPLKEKRLHLWTCSEGPGPSPLSGDNVLRQPFRSVPAFQIGI